MTRQIAILIVLYCLIGCGGRDSEGRLDLGGEDANKVGVVIDEVNDAKGNPKRLAALFAKGATLPDTKKINPYGFFLSGKPSVSGAEATCKVRIEGADGSLAGEKDWVFVKEGDAWKIKSAPLP